MDEYEMLDEQRKRLKARKLDSELLRKMPADAPYEENDILADVETCSDDDDHDEFKYAEDADMAGQKVDMKSRLTVRNLRIREDIPKYLRNLDLDSAHYDPKTRSMRDNPLKDLHPEDLDYAGDNFHRLTGDAQRMTETMVFAWQAAERGHDVHMQANPSQAELFFKEFVKKREAVQSSLKSNIIEQYGGEEHLFKPNGLPVQSEEYVEYSRTGRVVKGTEKARIQSKYLEDFYPKNHTAVWGSYWQANKWGYACCHSFHYNSYCTGQVGRDAFDSVKTR